MKLSKIMNILDGKLLYKPKNENIKITSVCGSDLMSDVMAFVKDSEMLLTGLVNPQVIRTAEMMDIKVIVFVRGKTPVDSVLNLAKQKDIAILTTKYPLYIASGLLYKNGLTGGEENIG